MQETRIHDLLAGADDCVRRLAWEAIFLARSRQLPAEILASKLNQYLDRLLEDLANGN